MAGKSQFGRPKNPQHDAPLDPVNIAKSWPAHTAEIQKQKRALQQVADPLHDLPSALSRPIPAPPERPDSMQIEDDAWEDYDRFEKALRKAKSRRAVPP